MVNKLIKNFLSVLTFIIISILIVIRLFISVTQPYGGEGINHSFIHYRINIFAIIFIIILIIVINKAKVKNLNDQTKSFLCFIIPGILLKTHKTSHSQYTHPFYQSCLTVIDNGLLYLVEY